MANVRKLVLVLALIAAVFGRYLLTGRPPSPSNDRPDQAAGQSPSTEDTAPAPAPAQRTAVSETAPDSTGHDQDGSAVCLDFEQLESHPLMLAEYARIDSLATTGPTIEAYQGLPSPLLVELAAQGDSAAMAVLGAMSVMRAMKLPDDKAVPYLLLEEPGLWSSGFESPLDQQTSRHLEEAFEWFYRSAVHGRLLALENAGDVLASIGASPTVLGWIEESHYESLELHERHALSPANVYAALAFEIAPELRSSPLIRIISDQTPGGEQQLFIVRELTLQFRADRESAGLPPIAIVESSAPSLEELEAMLCEP